MVMEEIRKLKGKVAMEEKDKDHSNLMLKYYKDDGPNVYRVADFTSKVSKCMHRVGNLQQEITRLKTLHYDLNSRLLSAFEALRNLNKEIKDRKEA